MNEELAKAQAEIERLKKFIEENQRTKKALKDLVWNWFESDLLTIDNQKKAHDLINEIH